MNSGKEAGHPSRVALLIHRFTPNREEAEHNKRTNKHLAACERCRRVYEKLSQEDFIREVTHAQPSQKKGGNGATGKRESSVNTIIAGALFILAFGAALGLLLYLKG